jgi:D-tyrosyl-tRNA(Tyr) deacylase
MKKIGKRSFYNGKKPKRNAESKLPSGKPVRHNVLFLLQQPLNQQMRAVVQRVREASVSINGKEKAAIGKGLLVLVGIEDADSSEDVEWLSGKITRLRIFADKQNLMNLSVQEAEGEILAVSQFTLHASTKKGNRPSFIKASKPETAIPLYENFLNRLSADLGKPVKSGEFGANMQVRLVNDGPVTIFIDTKNRE